MPVTRQNTYYDGVLYKPAVSALRWQRKTAPGFTRPATTARLPRIACSGLGYIRGNSVPSQLLDMPWALTLSPWYFLATPRMLTYILPSSDRLTTLESSRFCWACGLLPSMVRHRRG